MIPFKLLKKTLNSLAFNIAFLVLICFILFWWIFNGTSHISGNRSQEKADETIAAMVQTLQEKNPEAAAELARLQNTLNERALAATLKERYETQGVKGLERLAAYRKGITSDFDVYDLRLAEMMFDNTLFASNKQRWDFANAHGLALQQQTDFFHAIPDEAFEREGNAYLQTLQNAADSPEQWRRVRENPIYVFLLQRVDDTALLDFYDREKDWLDDVLFLIQINAANDSSIIEIDGTEEIPTPEQVLRIVSENHPYFKNAVESVLSSPEHEVESTLVATYTLFANYGPIFKYCAVQGLMPLEEILDVAFANQDYFDKHGSLTPEDMASRLIFIRNRYPHVWHSAKMTPLCLQLYDDVPDLAENLCEKWASVDIAAFLYTKYDDAVPMAAAAIDKYGELGCYILERYEKSEIFHSALKDDTLGVRIIPYVTRFGDTGLAQLQSNKNWLDKYFDQDGNPKEKEWWTQIPGGGVADVARNWGNGYPCQWSEIGWGLVDVADAALLVVTLGASTPASTGKTIAVSGAKAGTKAAVRIGSKSVSRNVVETVTRNTTRAAAQRTVRLAQTQATSSLFRRGMSTSRLRPWRLVRTVATGGKVKYVLRAVETVATPARIMGTRIYEATRTIQASWKNIDPSTRRVICRALFYTGLAATVYYRTYPMLKEKMPQLWDSLGRGIGKTINNVGASSAAVLFGAVDEILKGLLPTGSNFATKMSVAWLLVSVILAFFVFWSGCRIYRRMVTQT